MGYLTPAPPIHSGTVAHVRTTTTGARARARPVLWRGTDEWIFFNPSMKIRSHGELNPRPEECYSSHLTNSARGPFAVQWFYVELGHNYLFTGVFGVT